VKRHKCVTMWFTVIFLLVAGSRLEVCGTTTLLSEDFDDGKADGFTEIGDAWDVDNGQYLQSAESPPYHPGPYRSWVKAGTVNEYTIEVDCTPVSGQETKVIYAHGDSTEDYRIDFSLTWSRLTIPKWGESWLTRATRLGGLNLSYERSYRVKIEVSTAGVKVWLDRQLRHDEPWMVGPPLGDGTIALGTFAASSRFDNVRVSLGAGVAGKTWYVDGSVLASGNGSSWPEAFETIQEGINAASDGDTVIVARATYLENISLTGKDILLRSVDPLDPNVIANTIIDGRRFAAPAVTFQGTETELCILSGFTIQNGNSPYGGGVVGHNSKATIRHNVIEYNTAENSGGGLYGCDGPIQNNVIEYNMANDSGGGLAFCDGPIQDNTIAWNEARIEGGGLFSCSGPIHDNTISDNEALQNGGGLSSCGGTIQNNKILNNHADWNGGGVHWCDGTIRNNTISGNSAAAEGGGLYYCHGAIQNNTISGNSADTGVGGGLCYCPGTIQNNTISGNSADAGNGGGLATCGGTIQNNTITGNSAVEGGGLVGCTGTIRNNTITGNSAAAHGGGLHGCNGTIKNCIIWGNTAYAAPGLYSSSSPTYSCIQDGTGGVEGNITGDPQFVGLNDYRLKLGSPCIDAGKNAPWMWGAVDLDGNNRIFNGGKSGTVDMGAYEYGSFRFNIVKVEETPANEVKLTWTSRPGDTYFVYSSESPSAAFQWRYEFTVPSEGERTTWTGSTTTIPGRFYRVEL